MNAAAALRKNMRLTLPTLRIRTGDSPPVIMNTQTESSPLGSHRPRALILPYGTKHPLVLPNDAEAGKADMEMSALRAHSY